MPSSLVKTVTRCWEGWPRRLTAGGVVVGVSGGVDSVVLLEILGTLARKHEVPLTVAHAHHGLRGTAADTDAAWVCAQARRLGFPYVEVRLNIRGERERTQGSVEMTARRLRHAFLARTARETGARSVALAHHGDDQVELFLLRLFRGSGGDGLGGMAEVSPSPADPGISLLRPLLDVTRAQILAHARQCQLDFREDTTNQDTSIPRNRIRHIILPWLRKQVGEHLDGSVRRSAEIVRADATCVENLAAKWLASLRPGDYRRLPVAVQRAVIRRQLWELGCAVEFDLVERLRLTEVKQSAAAGRILARTPAGRVANVDATPDFSAASCTLTLDGSGQSDFAGARITWQLAESAPSPETRKPASQEQFDATAVGGQVTVRHWQPGDRFQPLGLSQPAKLQDLFTNRKVPAAERRRRLIAATADGRIFWVEGLPPGESFKVGPATRLRLNWSWARNHRTETLPDASRGANRKSAARKGSRRP